MEYSELIKNRYTVRDFKPDAIPQDILDKILTAGQLAPTACNKQPQQIYIVRKPELIQKMRGITQCAYNAPVILILAGRKSEGWVNPFDNKDSTETDVSIVATHMMLADFSILVILLMQAFPHHSIRTENRLMKRWLNCRLSFDSFVV